MIVTLCGMRLVEASTGTLMVVRHNICRCHSFLIPRAAVVASEMTTKGQMGCIEFEADLVPKSPGRGAHGF